MTGLVNVFAGWTITGWIGCLILAFYDKPQLEAAKDKELEELRKEAEIKKLKEDLGKS